MQTPLPSQESPQSFHGYGPKTIVVVCVLLIVLGIVMIVWPKARKRRLARKQGPDLCAPDGERRN